MNLAIKNLNGILENIVTIRYFKFSGSNYLIFTKNEIDEAGYQKLYISKINNMVGNAIMDEVEWNLVRDTIKVIAKSNKEGTPLPIEDLEETQLNGIQIIGQKPFKLTASSVALLGANKKVNVASQPQPTNVQPTIPVKEELTSVAPTVSGIIDTPVMPATTLTPSESVSPAQPIQPGDSVLPVSGGIEQPVSQVTPQQSFAEFSIPATQPSPAPMSLTSDNFSAPASVTNPAVVQAPVFEDVSGFIEPSVIQSNIQNAEPVISNSNVFDFPAMATTVPNSMPVEQPAVDYKKLYEEQTLKLNALTTELDNYKNIIEQLKSILK